MKKQNRGITLISLVITIIVLLMIAGIVFQFVVGQNGIINRAMQAKQNYLDAETLESMQLNELYGYLITGKLPENTEDTDAGTIVNLPEKWKTSKPNYISVEDGSITKGTQLATTVYAVSDGKGNTIPVPINFYYVGGDLSNGENSGVIISDNEEDKYDGITDKTTHEYAPNLKGNQFIWIPCSIENYKKATGWNGVTANELAADYFDTSTNSAEKVQIEKYGGFYVGRYEAGTSEIKGINFATLESERYTDETHYSKITSGNVTSKANEIPYFHTDYNTAVEMSERMYKNDAQRNSYVSSGLITGTMWDVMLKTMVEKTGCDPVESSWGNYAVLKDEIDITGCRGMHCESGTNWSHGAWVAEDNYTKPNRTDVILTTGANSFSQKMHIYDVAGNLCEHTQEAAATTYEANMVRGGGYGAWYDQYPAARRQPSDRDNTDTDLGFRVVLYIK